MASTITGVIAGSTVTINPDRITGYQSSRPSKNIIHQIPDSDDIVVTIGDAGPRTGTLTLLFGNFTTEPSDWEAAAAAAEAILQVGQVFALTDDDVTTVNMTFVTTGDIVREVATDNTYTWQVQFGFQETL